MNQDLSVDDIFETLAAIQSSGLDGVWSKATQSIALNLNTEGFDLTPQWCQTPNYWTCPCCKRSKGGLAKRNAHGELSGRIVEHHDHFFDYAKRTLKRAAKNDTGIISTSLILRLEALSSTLTAFHPVWVCEDCNNIDSIAKKECDAPDYFSFPPCIIENFITIFQNAPHKLKLDNLADLWRTEEKKLVVRLNTLKYFDDILRDGLMWNSAEHIYDTSERQRHWAKCDLKRIFPGEENILDGTFIAASKGTPSPSRIDLTAWRQKPLKRLKVSTSQIPKEVINQLSQKIEFSRHSDEWVCPVCQRSKYNIIRPTNKEEYGFNSFATQFHRDSESREDDWFICFDCYHVRNNMAKELTVHGHYISFRDIKSIIMPKNNSSHQLVPEGKINEQMECIRKRVSMYDEIDYDGEILLE
jgi:rubredoxin